MSIDINMAAKLLAAPQCVADLKIGIRLAILENMFSQMHVRIEGSKLMFHAHSVTEYARIRKIKVRRGRLNGYAAYQKVPCFMTVEPI